ncbi:MAG TPA: M56 family metallopeptidase [Candidatus Limnocylindrales bacterium]|nr:M56 family metallopeptidase [Candidatus Limnocylindrales bacterium]
MNALLAHLPPLLKMSAQGAILIVLVLAVQWFCGKRLQPRWRYAFWLLVMLRLALPWTIPTPISPFSVLKLPEPLPAAYPTEAPPLLTEEPASIPEEVSHISSSKTHLLGWLWVTGVVFLAGYAGVTHYRIYQRVVRQRPVTDEATLNLLEDCKALMAVCMPLTLIETEAIASPTLFGFVRPRLLLPVGLRPALAQEELRHVFLHELAHIKRHDVLSGWVMLALQTIHWFNPLVWVAFHRSRADRELACDALALSYASPGENRAYGLTVVKLLERFGQPVWAPSLAGILENKQLMKERIIMIAKFQKTHHGWALPLALLIALTVIALTGPRDGGIAAESSTIQKSGGSGTPGWSLQEKLDLAQTGNQWAAYDLWDAYYRGKHGVQPDPTEAGKWLEQLVHNLWVVRFEPVDDFVPTNPGEFLGRIHQYSSCRSGQTNIGAASFFRTTKQGDKLAGAFLSNYPEELKASLNKVPGLKVASVDRITAKEFVQYERSPQESLWNLQQKIKLAKEGNQWAAYELWDAYYRGNHGIRPDPAEAEKWLGEVVRDLWVVKFEPLDEFAPTNPAEFLGRINQYSSCRSGQTKIGAASFFRTSRQGDKLMGSFLSNYPDQLKTSLTKVPGLKVTSVELITPKQFITYEQSPQESL